MSSPAQRLASRKKARKKPIAHNNGRSFPWMCAVAAERHALELSLDDVSKATGISKAALSLIEQGANTTLVNAFALSNFFGKPVRDLWPKRKD